jgi:hypothetical protein
MLESGEMWIAGNEEMRSRSLRESNEVIVAGVWREPGRNLRVGLNRAQAAEQGNIASNLIHGDVRAELGA